MAEKIQFVDENDIPIGSGPREEAWKSGITVRVVRAILRDENGRILTQHRSKLKKSYSDCWTDSASGHVDEGETYEIAMKREMEEEINITTDLKMIGKFFSSDNQGVLQINEINCVFEGTIPSNTKLELDPQEVTETAWRSIEELKRLMAQNPQYFTLGFREIISRFY